jgi:serine phosphatase RsbU (regulator of sigma subunit)
VPDEFADFNDFINFNSEYNKLLKFMSYLILLKKARTNKVKENARKLFLFTAGFFLTCLVTGQHNHRLDSLKTRLAEEKTDTGKVVLNYRISYELQFSDIEQSEVYAKKAYDEAVSLKFEKGIGNALIQSGNIKQIKGNWNEAAEDFQRALKILTKVKDVPGTAIAYNNLGIISHNRNDLPTALTYYRKALEINRSINRKSGEATSLYCIGTVMENQVKYDSALTYYLEGQEISESIGDIRLIAHAKTCLANVYLMMENIPKSLDYYKEAIVLYKRSGNDQGLLKIYNTLGMIEGQRDSLKKAISFYIEALAIGYRLQSRNDIANTFQYIAGVYEKLDNTDSSYVNYRRAYEIYNAIEDRENSVFSLISMARINNYRKNHHAAKTQLLEAIKVAREIGSMMAIEEAYQEIAMTYSYLNDFQLAFSYLNRYTDTKDSLMTVEKQKQILELQTQYETEKKEKENEILRKDQQILQTTRNSLVIGALLLILIALVILRSLSIKKKDNRLLQKQKEEIARQKDVVEEQKKSITDSIHYAKRIQSAMLPPQEFVTQSLPESFILYLPRDIVSGDFYWMKQVSETNLIVCAADCTGHGVPGAFMSMLGMSLLNDIINTNHDRLTKNELTPADILNELRSRIKSSLRQTGREGEARDGMDMSLCFMDRSTGKLAYAGANNSVYFVADGVLSELKATRNPIGIYLNELSFANNEAMLPKGSVLYMFSDGFSDQIGHTGGKFLSKNFKLLLSRISHLPVNEIKEKLHQTHLEWRKEEEQVDDILVIGIRI